ncbi:MAG: UDP-N-acetylglucosamine 2-epimerase (hydrolyzing) [Bacteroidetes bacterium]|nr:UDP-N-acetylglucosamine 2-epimerase (hydrolyzing) [Bacteroidota bacterium]
MSKRKVCVVVTARASYSRIKTALIAIQNHPDLELQLVVAASALLDKYGSAVNYIEEDGLKISERVFMVIEGATLATSAKSTGIGIVELSTTFDNLKPDVVCTIGDRYETMATAIAASYMNIPLVHIQGGEVTGNIDEKVRHAISKLADIHLVSNEDAKERLIKLGEFEDKIYVTGCPSIDLAKDVLDNPEMDFDPCEKYGGVGSYIDSAKPYLVVMQHPVTTEYSNAKSQAKILVEVIHELDINTFWFWPNPDAGSDGTSNALRSYREEFPNNKLRFFKNMEGRDFLKLLLHSKCLIGNSSVGIRECSFLGVPVVNIGSRQNRRLRAHNVLDVDFDKEHIKDAVLKQLEKGRIESESIYGSGNAGKNIADVISKIELSINKVISY